MDILTRDMRDWLAECGADPDDLAERDDLEVRHEVERRYHGGVAQFDRDNTPDVVSRIAAAGFIAGTLIA